MSAPPPEDRAAHVLAALVESAVDGIVVIDARGLIEMFNSAAERLFGYTETEVLGRNVAMLMPSPYREQHDGYLERYLRTGEARIIGSGREVTGLRRDGTQFPVHLSVGEMSVGGERRFTGILHDLSARVRMEERLREQAALVRLGEMAAVVAHEIKNPLAGIRGAVQVIGARMPPESRDAAVLGEVLTRIDTLNDLIQDLLLFARPPHPRPAVVEVSRVLAATLDLLDRDPALAAVEVVVAGGSPPVHADPELLKIVFQNLLVNGAQAMGGRGRIDVSLGDRDRVCHIRVSDRGPGIPADLVDKIFVPFFTTKARGTGLGLPTARRLVEAQQGAIFVESTSGSGTTIGIELPLAGARPDQIARLGPVVP